MKKKPKKDEINVTGSAISGFASGVASGAASNTIYTSGTLSNKALSGYTGVASGHLTSTTTTGTFVFNSCGGEITIDNFDFNQTSDGNFIEVVKRQKRLYNIYSTSNSFTQDNSDRVWKEIYGVTSDSDGNRILTLIKTVEGKITPAHHVEEDVSFDE